MDNIIIIGASGYIGKHMYNRASKFNRVYGTTTTGGNGLLLLRLENPKEFDYQIIQSTDVIFLTAAISAPDVCANEHAYAWKINVTGTSEFINKVIGRGGRVIFFSSDTVYGERDDKFDERSPSSPAGEYASMKHEVEKQFLGNPQFKTIRLSYVFSQDDKFTRYLSTCAKSGEEAELFHPFYRAVVHRDDVIEGALALAQRWNEFPGSIINFGGPEVLSRIEFAKILQEKAFPRLRFRVREPGSEFFKNRPKVIRMASPILASLLQRSAHHLRASVELEFN